MSMAAEGIANDLIIIIAIRFRTSNCWALTCVEIVA